MWNVLGVRASYGTTRRLVYVWNVRVDFLCGMCVVDCVLCNCALVSIYLNGAQRRERKSVCSLFFFFFFVNGVGGGKHPQYIFVRVRDREGEKNLPDGPGSG